MNECSFIIIRCRRGLSRGARTLYPNYRNEVAGIHYASDEHGEYQFALYLNFVDQVCKPTN